MNIYYCETDGDSHSYGTLEAVIVIANNIEDCRNIIIEEYGDETGYMSRRCFSAKSTFDLLGKAHKSRERGKFRAIYFSD